MKNDILFSKSVKIGRSIFDSDDSVAKRGLANGGRVDFDVPEDCDLVILMGNKGGGYVPYRCLLPHQVYVDDLKDAFEEKHFEVIYVIPINSESTFQIAYNGSYGKQRWGKSE